MCTGRDLLLLWILSSEMDQSKSGLIRRLFIKGTGAEVFRKAVRLPSSENPLKIPRQIVQLLAIRILIANAGMKFIAAFGRRRSEGSDKM
jgi:hypothetical protein